MNLIFEKHTPFSETVTVDIDEVLNLIVAESEWRASHAPFVFRLTTDHSRLLKQRVAVAFADLRIHLAGYLLASNCNPELPGESIVLVLGLEHEPRQGFGDAMHDAVVRALAFHVLRSFYGEEGTYYGTACRQARARILLLLTPNP